MSTTCPLRVSPSRRVGNYNNHCNYQIISPFRRLQDIVVAPPDVVRTRAASVSPPVSQRTALSPMTLSLVSANGLCGDIWVVCGFFCEVQAVKSLCGNARDENHLQKTCGNVWAIGSQCGNVGSESTYRKSMVKLGRLTIFTVTFGMEFIWRKIAVTEWKQLPR